MELFGQRSCMLLQRMKINQVCAPHEISSHTLLWPSKECVADAKAERMSVNLAFRWKQARDKRLWVSYQNGGTSSL